MYVIEYKLHTHKTPLFSNYNSRPLIHIQIFLISVSYMTPLFFMINCLIKILWKVNIYGHKDEDISSYENMTDIPWRQR